MNSHHVLLNGTEVANATTHYKVLTMVRSVVVYDMEGESSTRSELVVEGVDEMGKVVKQYLEGCQLQEGDVVQITIGSPTAPESLS